MDEPGKCILIVLDGLGDRAYDRFGGRTPLAAAHTPTLDRLAGLGANGLFHAARPGLPLPSENAHFAMFGYGSEDFPGRGPLEALGAGVDVGRDDVAVLARLVSADQRDGRLFLRRDKPERLAPEEPAALFSAVGSFQYKDVAVRLWPGKGLFGVITLSGEVDPRITDSNPMRDGCFVSEILPHADAPPAAAHTARALKAFLVHAHAALCGHPVNAGRVEKGLSPVNMVVTQRAGRLGRPTPFRERFGMRGLSVSSGVIYHGLCAYLGMDVHKVRDTVDPGRDLAERLDIAVRSLETHDFIHVHTKAPDEAAHAKDPDLKKEVVESLDAGLGEAVAPLLEAPGVMTVVTADHSTPSAGPLIHSGEPVPVVMVHKGARRDAVTRFDEVGAASGALGLLRGRELLYTILNATNRARLAGIRDTPQRRLFWPGEYEPFALK